MFCVTRPCQIKNIKLLIVADVKISGDVAEKKLIKKKKNYQHKNNISGFQAGLNPAVEVLHRFTSSWSVAWYRDIRDCVKSSDIPDNLQQLGKRMT